MTNIRNSTDNAFPGGVEVVENGIIKITIQKQTYSSMTKFYLVITDSNGKEVKRTRVYPSNPKVSLSSNSLPPGEYTLVMAMVNGSSEVHSSSATWKIVQPELSIPSGDEFPGKIMVNPDGTYSITITADMINRNYYYYNVIWDSNGKELKRIKFDPAKPITKKLTDLKIGSGGFFIVIEVMDPKTKAKVNSSPTFTIINNTKNILVAIDQQLQQFDQPPVSVDGRTLVPLRAIFEALGAEVKWDDKTKTVTATKDDTLISLTIDSVDAWINGTKTKLDVPAQLINGKTMVPIRFVSEALGAKVEWDPFSHSVIISNKL
jgi:hypothetical protein